MVAQAQSNRKAVMSEAQPKKLGLVVDVFLEGSADKSTPFTVFWKPQPSKVRDLLCFPRRGRAKAWYLLGLRRLSRVKDGIYNVFGAFEGSTDQSTVFTVFGRLREGR